MVGRAGFKVDGKEFLVQDAASSPVSVSELMLKNESAFDEGLDPSIHTFSSVPLEEKGRQYTGLVRFPDGRARSNPPGV
jgi:hypothetical protein